MLNLTMIMTVLFKHHKKHFSFSESKHRKIVAPYPNSPWNP